MTNVAELQANIDSRKIGEDLFLLAKEEIDRLPESHRRRAWALLAYRIADHTGTIEDSKPAERRLTRQVMTSEQSAMFERGSLPFQTRHGSAPISQIDIGYLSWLHEKHEKDHVWFERLGAYLNSERVNAEIPDSEEREDSDG